MAKLENEGTRYSEAVHIYRFSTVPVRYIKRLVGHLEKVLHDSREALLSRRHDITAGSK